MGVLFLVLFYILISAISYIFWYWWCYKEFKKTSYKNFEDYLDREWGYSLVLPAMLWPITLLMICIFIPINCVQEFIRTKIEK